MGGWIGAQADYVMVPYADFNLLKFPDKAHAMEKIRDLTCLSDILPTGFHGAVTAKLGVGSTVYVAGAGPVGLAAADRRAQPDGHNPNFGSYVIDHPPIEVFVGAL